jgi:hypothetical protein
VSDSQRAADILFGLLMLWTLVGFVGLIFGLRIGPWDALISLGLWPEGALPADPRRT